MATQGLKVHGFKFGAEVFAVKDVTIKNRIAVKKGALGIVQGPSDDGDRSRLLVEFRSYPTAINVLPVEVQMVGGGDVKCPSCWTVLPNAAPVPKNRHNIEGIKARAFHFLAGKTYFRWWLWFSLRRPEQQPQYALEGLLPPPSEEPSAPPSRRPSVASIAAVETVLSVATASPPVPGVPEPPSVPSVPHSTHSQSVRLEQPNSRSPLYARYPEVEVSLEEHHNLKLENEALRGELDMLRKEMQHVRSAPTDPPSRSPSAFSD